MNIMRKKFLSGLLVAAMVASMTACGSDPTANNNSSSDKNSDSGNTIIDYSRIFIHTHIIH